MVRRETEKRVWDGGGWIDANSFQEIFKTQSMFFTYGMSVTASVLVKVSLVLVMLFFTEWVQSSSHLPKETFSDAGEDYIPCSISLLFFLHDHNSDYIFLLLFIYCLSFLQHRTFYEGKNWI